MRRILVRALVAWLTLATLVRAQLPFPVVTTIGAREIAGRAVELDARGKLLPWPFPGNIGDSYSNYFISQWAVLLDQFERQRLPYFYCCFAIDPTTYELTPDRNWANSTAYLRAMIEGFVERLYAYTGDERTVGYLEEFVDYEMENGLTPPDYQWGAVPYPSANPGAAHYGGWSSHGEDYVEPHEIGEDGYAYVRLYEMTGKRKYLQGAIHFADELVKNYRPGDAGHSPWPVRCFARDGRVEGKGMGPYSANVLGPISLFDELVRLKQGEVAEYARVRRAAWQWLLDYPLRNNVWVGYFEDVPPTMANMNNVIPLELARYVVLHPEKDGEWRAHARQLIEWVKTTPKWPKYRVHGALITTEQGDGANFCCNQPNQCCDSHTARLAAVEALYFARTGDESYKEEAFRSFNWVTYFQGLPGKAHAPFSDQWWFTDEYADGPRRLMDAFWAVPQWAPEHESHLLGATSIVTQIHYARGSLTYATFDKEGEEALRLDFEPAGVWAGGRKLRRHRGVGDNAKVEGFAFDRELHVLRIRHRRSGEIEIKGPGGGNPAILVTFDDPHRTAETALEGEYPAGIIDWGAGGWRIGAPVGKFGTFNVRLSGAGAEWFQFRNPRVLARVDLYNAGSGRTSAKIACGEKQEVEVALDADEVKRLRTGWQSPCLQVTVSNPAGGQLRMDNLGYY